MNALPQQDIPTGPAPLGVPAPLDNVPTDDLPAPGAAHLHPGVERAFPHDLLRPEHLRWTPRELRDLTARVIAEFAGPLLDVVEIHDDRRWWVKLGLTRGVELWLLSWAPGQRTRPHDHGGAAGSFAVLFGELREHYRHPHGPVRTADRELGTAIGFGGDRAHQIVNTSSVNAAGVHAYSPPLRPVRRYADLSAVDATGAADVASPHDSEGTR
ncbi:cysteine dioxygenase family protein [Saccharopolyspora cebuensis]|uniref:Cysteine dioxygenase family protein n=1 Tax=Saccharopolyspora cebuensis TaxID=418759 RepID=A0ABV4CF82_9PSEU